MQELPTTEDFNNIRQKIIDYLSRQGFSERKLLQKVTDLKKNYPKTKRYFFYTRPNVQKVIDEMKQEGYIDDLKYAKDVLRQLKDRKDGIQRIRQKMYRRLIPEKIISEVLGRWQQQGTKQDYSIIVRNAMQKKKRLEEKYPGKKNEYDRNQRMYAFLAQKGYLPDDIDKIINLLNN